MNLTTSGNIDTCKKRFGKHLKSKYNQKALEEYCIISTCIEHFSHDTLAWPGGMQPQDLAMLGVGRLVSRRFSSLVLELSVLEHNQTNVRM